MITIGNYVNDMYMTQYVTLLGPIITIGNNCVCDLRFCVHDLFEVSM